MPFPKSDREVFPKNVIKEVICQLRFPPILRVRAQPPFEFQESLKHLYPRFEEESPENVLPPEIANLASGLSIRLGSADVVYKFLTEDRKRKVSLTPSFLALSESVYIDRGSFRGQVEFAEQRLRDVYGLSLSFYDRIGVRYRNVINRKELGIPTVDWYELFNPQLLGVLGADELRGEVSQILTQIELRVSDVADSMVRVTHGLGHDASGELVYSLDADFFTTHKWEGKDVSRVVSTFSELNGSFFRWAVAPRLKDVLRGS